MNIPGFNLIKFSRRNSSTIITATVSPNGQVILPTEILIALGLKPGDYVNFIKMDNGNYVVLSRTPSVKTPSGILQRPAQKTVSLEEMIQVIARGAVIV